MKAINRLHLTNLCCIGLFAILILTSSCSDSDEPKVKEIENEMVAKLVSGELSGEFTKYYGYNEEYNESTDEWNEMGPLYGGWTSAPYNFSIVDGKMVYKIRFSSAPYMSFEAIEYLWNAYRATTSYLTEFYVVKPFVTEGEDNIFMDVHNRPARIPDADKYSLTIVLEDQCGFTSGEDGPIPTPPRHEVACYNFNNSIGEIPDLNNCKTFSSINEAYQFLIDYGRDNWDLIKRYMPQEYKNGVDFDALEKRIKNCTVIF